MSYSTKGKQKSQKHLKKCSDLKIHTKVPMENPLIFNKNSYKDLKKSAKI